MSFYNDLIKFINQAQTDNLKTKHFPSNYIGTSVNVSFGQGNSARVPWISFLISPNKTQNGIYPVYLYYKRFRIIILSYGISQTNPPKISWDVHDKETISEYFEKEKLGVPENYGSSLIFKIYSIDSMPSQFEIDSDLNEIISKYSNLINNTDSIDSIPSVNFQNSSFRDKLIISRLEISELLSARFTASLLTKPFVILTGLSGSGKTKLAQAFVTWISASPSQFCLVPVGADWTNREPLLGYPNGLDEEKYSAPDSGSLQLIIRATENPALPYFLILDEMNLSHVERYFADFLSVMESQDKIRLYSGGDRKIPAINENAVKVPQEIGWPKNLFIIGTVNIDETTYMFSPKVLDRANVIEFRVSEKEMGDFLASPSRPDLSKLLVEGKEELGGLGQEMASDFMRLAGEKEISAEAKLSKTFVDFFSELQKAGAEFGYRSASEMLLLIKNLSLVAGSDNRMSMDEKVDIAIMQKLLPKLHGSRNKLSKVLETLAGLCLTNEENRKSVKTDFLEPFSKNEKSEADFEGDKIRYKISFLKLCRMYKAVMENGYASYAEA